jgi:hypothetical protein
MKCPSCGAPMEAEDARIARTSVADLTGHAGDVMPDPGGACGKPSMHYRCEGCDSEWVWTKGERVRQLDGATYRNDLAERLRL